MGDCNQVASDAHVQHSTSEPEREGGSRRLQQQTDELSRSEGIPEARTQLWGLLGHNPSSPI